MLPQHIALSLWHTYTHTHTHTCIHTYTRSVSVIVQQHALSFVLAQLYDERVKRLLTHLQRQLITQLSNKTVYLFTAFHVFCVKLTERTQSAHSAQATITYSQINITINSNSTLVTRVNTQPTYEINTRHNKRIMKRDIRTMIWPTHAPFDSKKQKHL